MRELRASLRARSALLALEGAAMRAGGAMACSFGCSAEFEAAVIRSRVVGRWRRRSRGYILAGAIAACCLLGFLCLV
jgi:hypothetical protein